MFLKFIDKWKNFATWREEKHLQCILATESSSYKWGGGGGGFLLQPQEHQEFGDYWNSGVSCPIHVKEARSVVNASSALKQDTTDHRVDVFCDYLAVVKAWSNQGAKDPALNAVLKGLFDFTFDRNVNLHIQYIRTGINLADEESRRMSAKAETLKKEKWTLVEEDFGPHSVDLMAVVSLMLCLTGIRTE